MAALQQRFTAAGRALAPKQERDLADVLHEVRAGVVPALDPEDLSLLVLSAETLAPRIKDQQRIDTLLRTKAAAVLDPAQLEILAAYQADRLKALQVIVDAAPKSPAWLLARLMALNPAWRRSSANRCGLAKCASFPPARRRTAPHRRSPRSRWP